MRTRILTPAQAKAELERMEAECWAEIRHGEIGKAHDQYQKARERGDRERASYWSAVELAVRQGDRLKDTASREHDRRDGPNCTMTDGWGRNVWVKNLDHWRLS